MKKKNTDKTTLVCIFFRFNTNSTVTFDRRYNITYLVMYIFHRSFCTATLEYSVCETCIYYLTNNNNKKPIKTQKLSNEIVILNHHRLRTRE